MTTAIVNGECTRNLRHTDDTVIMSSDVYQTMIDKIVKVRKRFVLHLNEKEIKLIIKSKYIKSSRFQQKFVRKGWYLYG